MMRVVRIAACFLPVIAMVVNVLLVRRWLFVPSEYLSSTSSWVFCIFTGVGLFGAECVIAAKLIEDVLKTDGGRRWPWERGE